MVDTNPNLFKLNVNDVWNSSGSASEFIAGGNDNGRISWKHDEKTLAILEEENEKSFGTINT